MLSSRKYLLFFILTALIVSCQDPAPTMDPNMDYIEFESVWQYCKAFSIFQDNVPPDPFHFAEPDDIMIAIHDTLHGNRYTRYVNGGGSGAAAGSAASDAASTVYFDPLTDSTALITITTFDYMTYDDFMGCISDAGRFSNFIIDVRQNRGGYLDELDSIIQAIVPAGTNYIQARERDNDTVENRFVTRDWHPWTAEKGEILPFYNKRIAVLMDTLSASASEILAAAMYEGRQAKLIGMRSYGKGIGQIQLMRRTRQMLQITFLQLKGVSDRIGDYHRHGIAPDTIPDSVVTEGAKLLPVNRPIFYALKFFEPGLSANDVVNIFPPRRIPAKSLAWESGLCKVVSEDEVRLPGTK